MEQLPIRRQQLNIITKTISMILFGRMNGLLLHQILILMGQFPGRDKPNILQQSGGSEAIYYKGVEQTGW
jgi:hypothetical protein